MSRIVALVAEFVNAIPDEKLKGLPVNAKGQTIWKDVNFRLDLQGMTSDQDWNLQVQVNNGCKIPTLRAVAPDTIAGPVIVDRKKPQTPAEIKAQMKKKVKLPKGPNIPPQPNRGMPGDKKKKDQKK